MRRQHILTGILVVSVILLVGVCLHAEQVSRSELPLMPPQDSGRSRQLSDEIFILVPNAMSPEQLQAIASSTNTELLGLAGMASGVSNANYWTVDVPWATSDADVERVRQVLASSSDVISAEVNPWVFPQ